MLDVSLSITCCEVGWGLDGAQTDASILGLDNVLTTTVRTTPRTVCHSVNNSCIYIYECTSVCIRMSSPFNGILVVLIGTCLVHKKNEAMTLQLKMLGKPQNPKKNHTPNSLFKTRLQSGVAVWNTSIVSRLIVPSSWLFSRVRAIQWLWPLTCLSRAAPDAPLIPEKIGPPI